MQLYFFAIKDLAAQAYMSPFSAQHIGVASRQFIDEVNREHDQNNLFHHPDDFELYSLGVFDNTTGLFDPTPPTLVHRAKDIHKNSLS